MRIILLFAVFGLVLSVALISLIAVYMLPPEQRLPEHEILRNKIDLKLQWLTNKFQFLFMFLWSALKEITIQWGDFIDDMMEDLVTNIS
jgi:ABC-type lipoprotein release transport system permease subunit